MSRFAKTKVGRWLRKSENILLIAIATSAILAIGLAYPIRLTAPSSRTIELIRFPGDLFFRLLKLCVLPVVICSILSGVTSLDLRTSTKLGGLTLIAYLSTTIFASLVGVILVNIIQPGKYAVKQTKAGPAVRQRTSADDSVLDLFRNMFPDNMVRATMQQVSTVARNVSQLTENGTQSFVIEKKQVFVDGSNFMGIIFFSILFGFVLITFGARAKRLIKTINLLNDVTMRMMMMVLWLSPVGIFFLILATLLSFKDIGSIIQGMGMMVLTTMIGLIILAFIVYPLLYLIFIRRNPFRVLYKTLRATIFAFAVCSSSATLPLTFQCCEEKLGINKAVTRFMLPIGAVVNMDGTAVHLGGAGLFIAQLNGIPLSFGEMLMVVFMGAVASIACATVPGSGIVSLIIVLSTAGLPVEDASLFFMTDWFLSRCRTATNVLGDSFVCSIVASLCKKDLSTVTDQREPSMNGFRCDRIENDETKGDEDETEVVSMTKMV